MTEKVVLTKEQAKAIERWENGTQLLKAAVVGLLKHGEDEPIAEMPTETLAKAIYIGYEVEPEFKNDEWVVLKSGEIVQIHYVKDEIFEHASNIVGNTNGKIFSYDKGGDYWYGYDLIDRHATPEEIAEEKERRWWKEHGREPWELRKGDVLVDTDGEILEVTDKRDDSKGYYLDYCSYSLAMIKSRFIILTFAENRLDVKTND